MNQKNSISNSCRDAVNEIHSGDSIWIGGVRGAAAEFLTELAARDGQLKDITVIAAGAEVKAPCAELLQKSANIRFLFFSPEAVMQTYRRTGEDFIHADDDKIAALLCGVYGINVIVTPVCPPDESGFCALADRMAPFTGCVSGCGGILKRIALIDPDAVPAYGSNWSRLSQALLFRFYGDARGHELLRLAA
jgi:hypothetical protein